MLLLRFVGPERPTTSFELDSCTSQNEVDWTGESCVAPGHRMPPCEFRSRPSERAGKFVVVIMSTVRLDDF